MGKSQLLNPYILLIRVKETSFMQVLCDSRNKLLGCFESVLGLLLSNGQKNFVISELSLIKHVNQQTV